MNSIDITGYTSRLEGLSRKDLEIDEKSLEILEQFAWKKHLSAYQICSNLKSTHLKMAYKNVNKRTNALLSSGLIQKLETDSIHSKHNAKYYRLTEYGIYQLFLNRLDSLLVNQSDVRKGSEISQSLNALTFYRNYIECDLFKIFLYPYFKKETLLAIGSSLLWDLYNYLSTCCHSIERKLKYSKLADIPVTERIFSWDKIPGKDDASLLSHLEQIFNLESVDRCDIKKEDTFITINLPSVPPIKIELDKERSKVLVMSRSSNDEFKELQYDVHQLGQEMIVGRRIASDESMKDIVNDSEKKIEQLVYEFVYHLASLATGESKEYSYYCELLSLDDKFMRMVEKIYQDRHKGFERGYKKLRNKN